MNKHSSLIKRFLCFCGIVTICVTTVSAQDNDSSKFDYQINRVQKYVSISPVQLDKATTLNHLNHYCKTEWVKEYKSVDMTVVVKGKKNIVSTANDKLTTTQKQLIQSADIGSDIDVIIHYIPDNNLSGNKIEEMDFSFRIDPEQEASFIGGKNQLDKYIEKTIINKVTIDDVAQYQVAAIKFTIDEEGHVVDAHVAQASKNKDADKLLLKSICEMPNWQSAKYSDGTTTKQEFVFTIGDPYSCTMNMLDIKSEVPPSTVSN